MPTLENMFAEWVPPDPDKFALERIRQNKETFNRGVKPLEGYEAPRSYESIAGLARIGLDTETLDPNLLEKGPGTFRKDGYIVGVGIGPRSRVRYYPVKHAGTTRNITFIDEFWGRLRHEAAEFSGEVVGANLQYDLEWLEAEAGVIFHRALIRDVQIAEPLIDENRLTYKLNALAKSYLGSEKLTTDLATHYGPGYIKQMHHVDPGYASRYCIQDVELALDIYEKQIPVLDEQGLLPLFDTESKLIPLLLKMRRHGVRIDMPKVHIAVDELDKEQKAIALQAEHMAGVPIDIWSADSIAYAFKKLEIGFPTTANGKPSFKKDWLAHHSSPIAQLINQQRGLDKIKNTFLTSYMINGAVTNEDVSRIHCQFNQLKSDEGGTVSGRFSSSYPNLQNIPARDPRLGPLCRGLFIPEDDHDWGCTDWSQIEFRFLVHYAVSTFWNPDKHDHAAIKSALDAAEAYRNDPSTDFHKIAAAISGTDRKAAKNINFGVVYGMGVPKMAASLGKSIEEATPILNEFHTRMPFLRKIYDKTSEMADHRGYIKTILGRRRRFEIYEAAAWPPGRTGAKPVKFYGTEAMCNDWFAQVEAEGFTPIRNLRRAMTHKALNALLQGSAADLMKVSMVNIYEAGIFNTIIPHLTVHDELDVSVPRTKEGKEAFEELKWHMANAMHLKVPVFASADLGKDWAEAKGKD